MPMVRGSTAPEPGNDPSAQNVIARDHKRIFSKVRIDRLISGVVMIGVVIGLVAPAMSADLQPVDVLREKVSEGIAVLKARPAQTDGQRSLREERLRQIANALFDFATMSRMVLASRWKTLRPAEQDAFVQAFAAFLQRSYLPVLLDRYNGEQIEYGRQVRLSTSRARVEVRVVGRGVVVPVEVKMIRRKGLWKIYDVNALGVSAISNYRAQFHWLLQEETPSQVIERLADGQTRFTP
jgi:ABC-type transporter MlaC component